MPHQPGHVFDPYNLSPEEEKSRRLLRQAEDALAPAAMRGQLGERGPLQEFLIEQADNIKNITGAKRARITDPDAFGAFLAGRSDEFEEFTGRPSPMRQAMAAEEGRGIGQAQANARGNLTGGFGFGVRSPESREEEFGDPSVGGALKNIFSLGNIGSSLNEGVLQPLDTISKIGGGQFSRAADFVAPQFTGDPNSRFAPDSFRDAVGRETQFDTSNFSIGEDPNFVARALGNIEAQVLGPGRALKETYDDFADITIPNPLFVTGAQRHPGDPTIDVSRALLAEIAGDPLIVAPGIGYGDDLLRAARQIGKDVPEVARLTARDIGDAIAPRATVNAFADAADVGGGFRAFDDALDVPAQPVNRIRVTTTAPLDQTLDQFNPFSSAPADIQVSNVFRNAGRDIVVVQLPDGTRQGFYKRTGGGGPSGTAGSGAAGQWVPFDGITVRGGDRWFNKARFTTDTSVNRRDSPLYRTGSQVYADIGNALDEAGIPVGREVDDPTVNRLLATPESIESQRVLNEAFPSIRETLAPPIRPATPDVAGGAAQFGEGVEDAIERVARAVDQGQVDGPQIADAMRLRGQTARFGPDDVRAEVEFEGFAEGINGHARELARRGVENRAPDEMGRIISEAEGAFRAIERRGTTGIETRLIYDAVALRNGGRAITEPDFLGRGPGLDRFNVDFGEGPDAILQANAINAEADALLSETQRRLLGRTVDAATPATPPVRAADDVAGGAGTRGFRIGEPRTSTKSGDQYFDVNNEGATASAILMPPDENGKIIGSMVDLETSSELRRQGFAEALVRDTMAAMRERGATSFEVYSEGTGWDSATRTRITGHSRELLTKLGFRETGRKNIHKDREMVFDLTGRSPAPATPVTPPVRAADEAAEEVVDLSEQLAPVPSQRKSVYGSPQMMVQFGQARVPRYWYHYRVPGDLATGEGIDATRIREIEAADTFGTGYTKGEYIWLSPTPIRSLEDSLIIDISKLDNDSLRFTGQAEGNLLHRGNIPRTALVDRPRPATPPVRAAEEGVPPVTQAAAPPPPVEPPPGQVPPAAAPEPSGIPEVDFIAASVDDLSRVVGRPDLPADKDPLILAAAKVIREAKPLTNEAQRALAKLNKQKAARAGASARKAPSDLERGEYFQRGLGSEVEGKKFEKIRPLFSDDQLRSLLARIWSDDSPLRTGGQPLRYWNFDQFNADKAFKKLFDPDHTIIPAPFEIALLEKAFGTEFVRAILSKRSLGKKAWDIFVDVWNLPRATLATLDISSTLRQAAALGPGNKQVFRKAFISQLKAFAKESYAVAARERMRANPNFERFTRKSGRGTRLSITDFAESTALANREEVFLSRLTGKIPGIRNSARAYTTMLNELRFGAMENWVKNIERGGLEATDEQLDAIATFINYATGRGPLGPAERALPILNGLMFSPRLTTSRFALPATIFLRAPGVRKKVVLDLVSFALTFGTVLTLANAAPGVSTTRDGKIRIGKAQVDLGAGFLQPIRFVRHLLPEVPYLGTGKRTSSSTGTTSTVKRDEEILRFLRSKAHPSLGFGIDVITQKDFLGDEFNVADPKIYRQLDTRKNPALRLFTPLIAQDVQEAVQVGGVPEIVAAAAGGTLGAGVTTFDSLDTTARETYGVPYPKLWPFEKDRVKELFRAVDTGDPSEFDRINDQHLKDLNDLLADKTLTRSQKVSEYFRINTRYSGIRQGTSQQIFGDMTFETVQGGSEAQQAALQQYYDELAKMSPEPLDESVPSALFDTKLWEVTLGKLEKTWKREGTLDYVNANINRRPIPEGLFDILPPKTRARIKVSSDARAAQELKRPLLEQQTVPQQQAAPQQQATPLPVTEEMIPFFQPWKLRDSPLGTAVPSR